MENRISSRLTASGSDTQCGPSLTPLATLKTVSHNCGEHYKMEALMKRRRYLLGQWWDIFDADAEVHQQDQLTHQILHWLDINPVSALVSISLIGFND